MVARQLNVNFNQISTLENLQVGGRLVLGFLMLEVTHTSSVLFLAIFASVLLHVTDISPLRSLLKLNTISVYGNLIADLDASLHTYVELIGLTPDWLTGKLRALDLGGNPCSRELEGYKFQVVRVLPRLKTLDGDHVTQLDKDLAEEFFAKAHRGSRSGNNGSIGVRPFTAPAGARGILTTDPTSGGPTNGFDPFASKLMPRGNVRLFRDDFLNNHPILLEYLVQDARGTSLLDAEHAVNQTQLKFASEEDSEEAVSSPGTSSFVDKMRNANPLSGVKDETSDLEAKDQAAPKEARGLKQRLPSTLNVPTSHLCVDPSDPSTTIRKLLKHIEILMVRGETLASHKNRGLDACSEELLEENKQLQTENNNIPILQEQIEDLKKKLAVVGGNPDSTRLVETKRVKSLEVLAQILINACRDLLLRRTKETEQSLKALQSPRVPSDAAVAGNSMNQDDSVPEPMRLSHSEVGRPSRELPFQSCIHQESTLLTTVLFSLSLSPQLLDESASIDVELTELILQNEVSLELIRNVRSPLRNPWRPKTTD
ncbi:hypothetical protein BBJ28_00007717 [Nothophytophthora sp. Chile5]|nr:hypothetical protein BBJ28_00007717 [Nothophytophthora sp. Chile5]